MFFFSAIWFYNVSSEQQREEGGGWNIWAVITLKNDWKMAGKCCIVQGRLWRKGLKVRPDLRKILRLKFTKLALQGSRTFQSSNCFDVRKFLLEELTFEKAFRRKMSSVFTFADEADEAGRKL